MSTFSNRANSRKTDKYIFMYVLKKKKNQVGSLTIHYEMRRYFVIYIHMK